MPAMRQTVVAAGVETMVECATEESCGCGRSRQLWLSKYCSATVLHFDSTMRSQVLVLGTSCWFCIRAPVLYQVPYHTPED
jgi:hypothetical protein